MNLAPGVKLGPYEIVAPIGAGGMGEVYRARDTRLDRTVAIKVLPAALAQNAQLRVRFEREAKAISALSHPNICTLHDVGTHDGVEYLVMEHLDGESLAERIARGPLPIQDAIRYAVEIADALDKAHRRGIVHRDLKPGNIMITRSGAKLLDFGLARSIESEPAGGADDATLAHTPLTEEGTIVGTMQYMAPEQLDSRPADARTDIFAFGAVLYEMLTGRRAFSGKSRSSLIASIVAAEPPPVSTVRPLTPAALERVIRICLTKDPDERWQSAHDLKLELQGLALTQEAAAPGGRRASLAGWIAAAVIALAAVGWAAWERAQHRPEAAVQFEMPTPPGALYDSVDAGLIVSPDGRQLAVGILRGQERSRIHMRRLDRARFEVLNGTDGAYDLFWSGDGRQIGFFAEGKLKRYDLAEGRVSIITEAGDSRGATWSGDTIVYAPSGFGPLMRVAAGGGKPAATTELNAERKETAHVRPSFLPDGRRFLFHAKSAEEHLSGVYVGSLDSRETHRVLDVATAAAYVHPNRILYVSDGTLFAQPFDADAAKVTGAPVPVARNLSYDLRYDLPGVAAGGNVLAYFTRGSEPHRAPVVWIRGDGSRTPLLAGENLDLSRDGTRLAVMFAESQQSNPDIWVYDLRRGLRSRITFDAAADVGPVWSPDGRRIAYETLAGTIAAINIVSASGVGTPEVVVTHRGGLEPIDWSRDGRTLLAELEGGRGDLVTIDIASRTITPFASTPFTENSGRFSPDGKWIAYESDETGINEIYLQRFPADGTKIQVTSGGAMSARWTDDGRTLYYLQRDRMLVSVPLLPVADGMQVGPVTPRMKLASLDYVISGDGREILVGSGQTATATPITVTTNWMR